MANGKQEQMTDEERATVAVVQQAMDDWRMQNDPASDDGLTMAEFIVQRLAGHIIGAV